MIDHRVRVWPSAEGHPRAEQLAWKLAEPEPAVTEMVINRVIDDAAVATASLGRGPVLAERLPELAPAELLGLTVRPIADPAAVASMSKGIF